MCASFVVLTGASGAGKTTLTRALQSQLDHRYAFYFFDSIRVPSPEIIQSFGEGHQPGGAWQRAITIQWIERIAPVLRSGKSVLFEGQMRISFIQEALQIARIPNARIVLVDCDDETRIARLSIDRSQPELANADMLSWAKYLRDEAQEANCEIFDTSNRSLEKSLALLTTYLTPRTERSE